MYKLYNYDFMREKYIIHSLCILVYVLKLESNKNKISSSTGKRVMLNREEKRLRVREFEVLNVHSCAFPESDIKVVSMYGKLNTKYSLGQSGMTGFIQQ